MQLRIIFVTIFVITSAFFTRDIYAQWISTGIPKVDNAAGPVHSMGYNGSTLFVGFDAALYRTSDNGDDWAIQMYGLSNFDANVIITKDSTVFVGDKWNFLRYSSDNGVTWQYANLRYQVGTLAYIGDTLFAGVLSYYVFYTSDNGAHWDSTGLPDSAKLVSLYAVGNVLYAGTNRGVYSTSNQGASWAHAGLTNQYIRSFTNADNYFYALSDNGVFRTTDGGGTWDSVGSRLPFRSVSCIAAISNNIFAGTDSGMFLSTNHGATWSTVNDGLRDSIYITSIIIDGKYIFAGTVYTAINSTSSYEVGDVYRRPLSDFGISVVNEKPSASPSQFSLSQNYPNPFSGVTNVEYRIPDEEQVTLKVFNSLGEEVATLVSGTQSAGAHSASFNASGLQSGMYFYRLTAGMFSQTGKMSVMK